MNSSSDIAEGLKPCPFCGGEADAISAVGETWVRCMACEASGPSSSNDTHAITAWNTRPPTLPADGAGEAVAAELMHLALDLGQAWQVLPSDHARAAEARAIISATIATLNRLSRLPPPADDARDVVERKPLFCRDDEDPAEYIALVEAASQRIKWEMIDEGLCRVSQVFNQGVRLDNSRDIAINDMLKGMISFARDRHTYPSPPVASSAPVSGDVTPWDDRVSLAMRAIHDSDGRGLIGNGRRHLHERVARALGDIEASTLRAQQAKITEQDAEKAALTERVRVLERALREWKCPSCGGTGLYTQRTALEPATVVVCKVCSGDGQHPVARQALSESPNEK